MKHVAAILVMSAALVGCGKGSSSDTATSIGGGGGGGGGGSTVSISGLVKAGPVHGAVITAYVLNNDGTKGAEVTHATTGADGSYTLVMLPAQANAPMVLESHGGKYNEEHDNSLVDLDLPGSNDLHTVVSSVADGDAVAVTPATEVAYVIATNAGTVDAAAIDAANQQVSDSLGMDVVSVSPDSPAYASMLTTISMMAVLNGTNSVDMASNVSSATDAKNTLARMVNASVVGIDHSPDASNPIFAFWQHQCISGACDQNPDNHTWVNLSAGTAMGVQFSGTYQFSSIFPGASGGEICKFDITLTEDGNDNDPAVEITRSGFATVSNLTYVDGGNATNGPSLCTGLFPYINNARWTVFNIASDPDFKFQFMGGYAY